MIFRKPSYVMKYENNDVLDRRDTLYKQIRGAFVTLDDSLWAWYYYS